MDVDHHVLLSLGLSWNTGVSYDFLLQEIFQTLGSDSHLLHLLHWQADSLSLWHLESSWSNLETSGLVSLIAPPEAPLWRVGVVIWGPRDLTPHPLSLYQRREERV